MPTPAELIARRPVPGPPGEAGEPGKQDPGAPEAGTADPAEPDPATPDTATGDGRVDAALRRLDAIEELPVSEHVAQYDAVHRTLQDALATIDEG
jgi:hypothetical protein